MMLLTAISRAPVVSQDCGSLLHRINNEMVKLNITTDRALTPEEAETMGRQLIAASHAINRTKN